MSRNTFLKVKSYVYVCDKQSMDEDDKWAMLLLLAEVVNKKLIQLACLQKTLMLINRWFLISEDNFVRYNNKFLRDNNKFD